MEGDDGVTYCDCWQWKKNRTCKHIEEQIQNQMLEPIRPKAGSDDAMQRAMQEALSIVGNK